ncbi:MAG: putative transport system permease protein [Pseudonocardiales bacterium]|nr:putative transport system permease protein [Pseudonocardiales bacterium]
MTMHRHRRERRLLGGALRTSPWLRGPILLLRHPAVFLAIVAATAVLAIAAASGVLFVSTLDTASLQNQAAGDCPERSMPGFSSDVPAADAAGARVTGLRAMSAHEPLGTPYAVELGYATVQTVPVNFYSRPGALDHVTKLRSVGGPGAWIPDNFVQQWHVQPGEYLRTTAGRQVRVAGVYKSMSPNPFQLANVPQYFCQWSDLIIRRVVEYGTGPFVIADEATLAAAVDDTVQISWYDPLPLDSISLSAAEHANRRGDEAANAYYGEAAAYARPPEISPPAAQAPIASADTLDHMIATAREGRAGVSGSVLPIDLAGAVVAALLVAGAGGFWATHRAREIRLLVARGVGPGALAGKAVLETAPAVIVGTGAGYAIAIALVRAVSPTSVLGPGATVNALWAALAATAVGLVLIAVIGAIASRERLIGARTGWHSRVPWELVLVGIAVLLALRIRSGSGVRVDKTVVHVSPTMVIFPLIGSLAVLLVISRVLSMLLPVIRRHVTGGGTAVYLAVRRIAGSRAIAVALLICVAMPGALLTYTSTLTSSVKAEVAAKYSTNLGAPRVLDVVGVRTDKPDLMGQGTHVVIYQSKPRLPGDTQTYVLGLDPQTFSNFALVTSSERNAVRKLHPVGAGAKQPAILVNADKRQRTGTLTIGTTVIPLDVVARSAVFPGLKVGAYPMIVVDRSALDNVDPNADRNNQVWTTNADNIPVRNVIGQAGYEVLDELTPTVLINSTGLLPMTWIFSYLRALAVMIGLVAIVGLVFALAARTRRRTVSYVLSRRMGLTRAAHVRSLILELTLVVGLGYAAGVGVGSAAFRLILNSLDIYPAFPPPASFEAPTSTWALTAAVWVAVILGASIAVQILADRAKPAEILRLE